MRTHRIPAEADPLADYEGESEGRGTRVDFDRRASGKVECTKSISNPATLAVVEAECPVRSGHVDQQAPGDHKHDPRAELGAIGDGAGEKCSGDDSEGELEHHEGEHRNLVTWGANCLIEGVDEPDLAQVTDKAARAVSAEGE